MSPKKVSLCLKSGQEKRCALSFLRNEIEIIIEFAMIQNKSHVHKRETHLRYAKSTLQIYIFVVLVNDNLLAPDCQTEVTFEFNVYVTRFVRVRSALV